MSLETLLAAAIAALDNNTAALLASKGSPTPASGTSESKPGGKAKTAEPKKDAGAPVVSMKQVADAGVALANNYSRDEAVAILTKYKVSKFSELKAEQLASALNDILAKTAELKAAADALAAKPASNDSLV